VLSKTHTAIFEPCNIDILVAACVVSFIVAIMIGGNDKSEQEALEKAKNELKVVEKNLAIANADIRNLKIKSTPWKTMLKRNLIINLLQYGKT